MFARIFIPKKHRQRFDDAVSLSLLNRMCRSKSLGEPQNRLRRSRSQDHHERPQGSKRASSMPRETGDDPAQPERGLRKSTTTIPSHYVTGANQRYVSYTSSIGFPFPCPIFYKKNELFNLPYWFERIIVSQNTAGSLLKCSEHCDMWETLCVCVCVGVGGWALLSYVCFCASCFTYVHTLTCTSTSWALFHIVIY